MSCLAWNCHGLRNLCTGRELSEIIRAKDPFVVFLVKTFIDDARLELSSEKVLVLIIDGLYQEWKGVVD